MKEYFLKLKEKINIILKRDSERVRFIAWRGRVTKTLLFLDNHLHKFLIPVFVLVFVFIFSYTFFWRAPRPFPSHVLVTIEKGSSLTSISKTFKEQKVVRSAFWLRIFTMMLGGEKSVVAGDYYFPKAKNVFSVSKMLSRGEFGLIQVRVTLLEGLSSYEIADILQDVLPSFNHSDFLSQVDKGGHEGYLFPDTYFFLPNIKAGDVILMMRENFARRVNEYQEDIDKSGRSLEEIVIMASILEGEGNSLESKRMISGILWNRLRIDMPLQVDAPFKYYNGKNSYTLTREDLRENHPFNTYVNKGLTPTPINNPGINAIRAAIAPTNSEYLYFLSDTRGNTYYARDFDGHQVNRERYLRQ
jgi:UPF0755 protein